MGTLFFSGCSFLPRFTFDTPNTVPQSLSKGKLKVTCKGEVTLNEAGTLLYCSKGYSVYEENYNKAERKYTAKEKFINIIRNTAGWLLIIGLLLLVGSLLTGGVLVGRVIEGAIGLPVVAFKAVMRGVQKARKQGVDLNTSLSAELDTKHKEYIKNIKNKENIV